MSRLPTQHTMSRAPAAPPRALPPVAEIVADLDDDDVAIAGTAIADVVELIARDTALDARAVVGDALRRAVRRHLEALPALLLARVFALVLRDGDDDSAFAVDIAVEVVEVGDDEDQLELVQAFSIMGAGAPLTSAVLRAAVWPRLGGRALFALLDDSDDDDSDDDGALWDLLATRVQDEDRPALQARLATRAARPRVSSAWRQMRDVVDDVVEGMSAFALRRRATAEAEHEADDAEQPEDLETLATRLGHAKLGRLSAFITALSMATTAPTLTTTQAEGFAADVGRLAGDARSSPSLQLLTRHVHRLALPTAPLQRILAQLLGLAVRDDDDDGIAMALAVLPDEVDHPILAFNLACLFARRGQREALLHWTRRSLALGKPASQFHDDSDFDAWRDDERFTAALAAG